VYLSPSLVGAISLTTRTGTESLLHFSPLCQSAAFFFFFFFFFFNVREKEGIVRSLSNLCYLTNDHMDLEVGVYVIDEAVKTHHFLCQQKRKEKGCEKRFFLSLSICFCLFEGEKITNSQGPG
jgi:hypothetical protein